MLPFGLYNKKNRLAVRHRNRPFFPMTLSIPSYDIGKYVGLRTYQHPLIYIRIKVSGNNTQSKRTTTVTKCRINKEIKFL
jgi:hypothetical protein